MSDREAYLAPAGIESLVYQRVQERLEPQVGKLLMKAKPQDLARLAKGVADIETAADRTYELFVRRLRPEVAERLLAVAERARNVGSTFELFPEILSTTDVSDYQRDDAWAHAALSLKTGVPALLKDLRELGREALPDKPSESV